TGGGRRPAVGWQLLARLRCLVVLAPLTVAGIRGGFATAVRPITISNANQYAERPAEAALVLNTPFSLYRTIGKAVFQVPDYFDSEAAMDSIYTPIHLPDSAMLAQPFRAKNVVVLIVESFGREYIGALNTTLEQGHYRGYTPSIDSIIGLSTTFTHSYCNGRKSIDGMPSILSSIPMFVEPFFLTPASMNHVGGLASLLAPKGYATAFFHGAQRGSMGFMAFARATGFQHYYGREDYEADPRFGGSADFDGLWAIWDEPFLQYYCQKMTEMAEPFMTAVFTASSHHPYKIPERYRKQYPEEGIVMHKCIRYTDMALGRFFRTASRQPWFRNTVFVLTSDHTNLSDHPEYQTDLGGFCSPIVIYEPGREPSLQHKVAQQIDILPTVLGMLHYDRPYCAFGKDLLNTPADSTWAVNYLNGTYQYVKYGHVLQFDGRRSTALYALDDSLMQRNLLAGADAATAPAQLSRRMERQLQAIIQQYMARMTDDRLQP
ncbi:MAG: LTA synthase family protein, partial [Prevotella sp.]|nr:LTA synthase family protein [Prevotella sp.]